MKMADETPVEAAEVQAEDAKNDSKSSENAEEVTAGDVASLKEAAKEKLVLNGGDNGNNETTNENSMDSNVSNNGHDGGDTTSNGGSVSSPKNRDEPQVVSLEDEDENPEEEEDEDILDEEDSQDDESQEDEDIQEVKDDSSDSDVMEVDAEDPLSAISPAVPKTSSLTSTEVRKPQVVTIDDPKTLQALASSARSKVQADKDKVTLIDTSAILAGRATSGVTITPARPKSSLSPTLPASLTSSLASSGVTISSKNVPASSFVYDSKGQLQDPNLTDDTIVIEAPSFIVPYVYEKPPIEKFEAFKAEIKKLMAELKAKAEEEAKNAKEDGDPDGDGEKKKKKKDKKRRKKLKKKNDDDEEDNGDVEDDDDYEENDEENESSDDDSDIVEVAKRAQSPVLAPVKKPNDNYFESSLGKFVSDLGMNMVQEAVQQDLLRQQQRKAKKDKSAAVMHAIISLKKNIEQSKENNAVFHSEMKKCKLCSFRTESQLVLDQHLETPHMRHGLYRCNSCQYETKSAQEVLGHMLSFHNIRAKLERAPAPHQCPQCPFEDIMKGKLTRHKVGCDKRFRPERNQEPAHDWEPPAKIPKPPTAQPRPGVSVLNAQGRPITQNFAGVRGALQQFNQKANPYSNMPSLQFQGRARGANFSKPFVPFNQRPQQALAAFAQAGRLAGNPSVTIQSISKASSLKANNPSISITPVPGGRTSSMAAIGGLKPGAPMTGSGKDNFIICEICDGYIRDLDQLRNHMQFVHKVKIHPKMIYNRPPLNCQKCQFRFFTDQGLERHLLGSHGLVTASMQDLANKGQDQGRCPVCGKMFHWKLLNHVAKDHMKVLKPAHLSYKCTVCTATFGQYKLFENHVYSAHSGGRKSGGSLNKPAAKPLPGRPFKMSDEITIIPQGRNTQIKTKNSPTISSASLTVTKKKVVPAVKATPKPADDPDVIEIDDEEEEIDDVEEEGEKKRNGNNEHESNSRKRKASEGDEASKSAKTSATSSAAEDSGEEGVEEIRDDEPEDD